MIVLQVCHCGERECCVVSGVCVVCGWGGGRRTRACRADAEKVEQLGGAEERIIVIRMRCKCKWKQTNRYALFLDATYRSRAAAGRARPMRHPMANWPCDAESEEAKMRD